jgi:hypothetical protein
MWKETRSVPGAGFPAGVCGRQTARERAASSLAGIRAGGQEVPSPSQARCFRRAQWLDDDETGARGLSTARLLPLTVAGAAQVGRHADDNPAHIGFLLPVELRHANHTASTNMLILGRFFPPTPTIRSMASGSSIDPLVERVERLLVRYEELQRTNALLAEQVELLTQERDSLKSRLSAARARVESLLERLPDLNTPA